MCEKSITHLKISSERDSIRFKNTRTVFNGVKQSCDAEGPSLLVQYNTLLRQFTRARVLSLFLVPWCVYCISYMYNTVLSPQARVASSS
jgi:hypothetical protein